MKVNKIKQPRLVEAYEQYDKRLVDATSQEQQEIVNEWATDVFGENFANGLDDASRNQILSWVRAYAKFDNPFTKHLMWCSRNKPQIIPSVDDLRAINNAFASRDIDEKDLQFGSHPILTNNSFYSSMQDDEEYWLEVYNYLSNPTNEKRIVNTAHVTNAGQGNEKRYLNFGGTLYDVTNFVDSNGDLKRRGAVRDAVIFENGKPGSTSKLRSCDDIEKILYNTAKEEHNRGGLQSARATAEKSKDPAKWKSALNKLGFDSLTPREQQDFINYVKSL